MGKKLSAKTRKDLDDVSEKTKVALKSCRRQVCELLFNFILFLHLHTRNLLFLLLSVRQFSANRENGGRSKRKFGLEYYAALSITRTNGQVSTFAFLLVIFISYILILVLFFRKYAAAVFITNNRFETSKKRLAYLSFNDFVACSNQMIAHWSYSAAESRQDDMDVDVDREFLHNLKDLKSLQEKEVIDDVRK